MEKNINYDEMNIDIGAIISKVQEESHNEKPNAFAANQHELNKGITKNDEIREYNNCTDYDNHNWIFKNNS